MPTIVATNGIHNHMKYYVMLDVQKLKLQNICELRTESTENEQDRMRERDRGHFPIMQSM